ECVNSVAFRGESDVASGEIGFLALVGIELLAVFSDNDLGGWTLAINFPRTGSINAFTVDGHPTGDAVESHHLFKIEFARIGYREIEQKIAVLADDIHQQVNDLFRRFVLYTPLVVPCADAGVGLPGSGRDVIKYAAFTVESTGSGCAVAGCLAGVDGFYLAAVPGCAQVIEVREQGKAVLVKGNAAIRIEEIRLVLVH